MMTRNNTLREDYFLWLYSLIDSKRLSYRKLCQGLHSEPFRWTVKNDDNRSQDGIELRQRFIDEQKLDDTHLEVVHFLKGECTIFEMLVALSQRIDDLQSSLMSQTDNSAKWFYEMLVNLALEQFTDMEFASSKYAQFGDATISRILNQFMDRTYDAFGNGSLFPLKRRPPKDMAKVEIWYQLMLYLDENYG